MKKDLAPKSISLSKEESLGLCNKYRAFEQAQAAMNAALAEVFAAHGCKVDEFKVDLETGTLHRIEKA